MIIKFNIEVFHENLELLRRLTGLSKKEFNNILKVVNAYRKDIDSIGDRIWLGIRDNFTVPDKYWLLNDHSEDDVEHIKFTRCKSLDKEKLTSMPFDIPTEHPAPYLVPPRTASPPLILDESELIKKTLNVLKSKTPFSSALKENIESFHYAMECIGKLDTANKRIDALEEKLKSIEERLPKEEA